MARCPVRKLDPGACVDFSTRGDFPTQKYKENWDRIFGKKKLPDAHTDRFK
jgi:hypothetical protein